MEVTAHPLDVSDERSVKEFIDVVKAFGSVDVLINNAGVGVLKRFGELSVEEIDRMLDTNVRGSILLTRAFLPGLTRKRSGVTLMISSTMSTAVVPGGSVYCATKGEIRALCRGLRAEYFDAGLRVVEFARGGRHRIR